ncbi:MAG: DedA family protein [bacterium]|nr:DedA family protein [bacterium]
MDIASFFNLSFILHKLGAWGLFFIIFVEEAGIPLPVPGDFLIIAEGRNSLHGGLGFWRVFFLVVAGTVIGSSLLYLVARTLGRVLILKLGKFLHFDEKKLIQAETNFRKHGGLMIVLGRLFPGFRTLTSVVAGIFKVPYLVFLAYTVLAASIWVTAYFFIGRLLGRQYLIILHFVTQHPYLTIPATLLVIILLFSIFKRAKKRVQ